MLDQKLVDEITEGHPKNPRGKFWESDPDRLYKANIKRLKRRRRNLGLNK